MPAGCSTWPAWWLVGPGWPNGGEIDIVEGINTNTMDQTTLHSNKGCDMSGESSDLFTGSWALGKDGMPSTDCAVGAPHEFNNQGCGIIATEGSFGTPFNTQHGGVFVLEWTDDFIRTFFFPRSSIPTDITSGKPDPTSWGKPFAYFTLGQNCPHAHFARLTMVINLTFCGDWAGQHWAEQCPGLGTCKAFVQNTPDKFSEAYWSINYVSVYQN